MKTGKIFASAGCGKTTELLKRLDMAFERGLRPQEVMFTTFTRSGAYEARDRAIQKFSFSEQQFVFFRTLHSLCFRAIVGPNIMTHRDYRLLGQQLHCRFGSAGLDTDLYERGKGDAMLSLYNLQRNILAKENLIPGEYGLIFSPQEYDHFIRTYEEYRNVRGLFDYTDLLEELLHMHDCEGLPIREAFIDEAQDLTPLQYQVTLKLATQAEAIWFAGDDDQSVFTYSGADPTILINMPADEKVILEKSYRLPLHVAAYANDVANRIKVREPKTVQAFHTDKEDPARIRKSAYFLKEIKEGEPTVILCRNRVFFGYFEEEMRKHGLLYSFVQSGDQARLPYTDLTRIRRAILLWEQMIDDPDKGFGAKEVMELFDYLPVALMPREGRKKVELGPRDLYSWNSLVKEHGLLALGRWKKSLTNIPYEEKGYFEVLERSEKLHTEPKIRLGTIHSFKGMEEDHVIVLPDMSWQTWKTYHDNPDSENRVFFVAVSRARERLTLLEPLTKYHYNW